MRPDAREAVRLQLDTDLQAVGLRSAYPPLSLLHLRQDAHLVLNVMSDLVSDHVGGGELACLTAAAAEAPFELCKECRVEKHTSIERTIEWSHCRLRRAA